MLLWRTARHLTHCSGSQVSHRRPAAHERRQMAADGAVTSFYPLGCLQHTDKIPLDKIPVNEHGIVEKGGVGKTQGRGENGRRSSKASLKAVCETTEGLTYP